MKLKNKTCKKKIKSKRSKRERRKKTKRCKMKGSIKVYRDYDVKNDDNKDGNNVEMVGGTITAIEPIEKLKKLIINNYETSKAKLKDMNSYNLCKLVEELLKEPPQQEDDAAPMEF